MSAANCNLDSGEGNDAILDCVFGYTPKNGPAALFLVLFFLAAQVNIYIAITRRSFLYAFIANCALAEMAGYIARLVVIGSFTTDGYIAMTVLLLITPTMMAIANYSLMGKLLTLSETNDTANAASSIPHTTDTDFISKLRSHFDFRQHLRNLTEPRLADGRIRPEFATSLFHVLAVATAIMQGVGIGNLSSSSATQSEINSGNHLIIAGLSIALFTYFCFFCVAFYTYFSPHYNFHTEQSPNMRKLFIGMVSTQAVLSTRTLFRLIQYALGTGRDNAISSREWCFFLFDATLVFICVCMFAAFDQSRTIERAKQEIDQRKQKMPPV